MTGECHYKTLYITTTIAAAEEFAALITRVRPHRLSIVNRFGGTLCLQRNQKREQEQATSREGATRRAPAFLCNRKRSSAFVLSGSDRPCCGPRQCIRGGGYAVCYKCLIVLVILGAVLFGPLIIDTGYSIRLYGFLIIEFGNGSSSGSGSGSGRRQMQSGNQAWTVLLVLYAVEVVMFYVIWCLAHRKCWTYQLTRYIEPRALANNGCPCACLALSRPILVIARRNQRPQRKAYLVAALLNFCGLGLAAWLPFSQVRATCRPVYRSFLCNAQSAVGRSSTHMTYMCHSPVFPSRTRRYVAVLHGSSRVHGLSHPRARSQNH